MGVTVVPLSEAGATDIGFKEGADPVLGPMDLIANNLPGWQTRGASLQIDVTGGAFTGMSVMGSVDGTTFYDVVDFWDGNKASVSTGSQLIVLGANYAHLKVSASGGDTTSVLTANLLL